MNKFENIMEIIITIMLLLGVIILSFTGLYLIALLFSPYAIGMLIIIIYIDKIEE